VEESAGQFPQARCRTPRSSHGAAFGLSRRLRRPKGARCRAPATARSSTGGCVACSRGASQPVAEATHGLNHGMSELLAKPTNVHLDGVAFDLLPKRVESFLKQRL